MQQAMGEEDRAANGLLGSHDKKDAFSPLGSQYFCPALNCYQKLRLEEVVAHAKVLSNGWSETTWAPVLRGADLFVVQYALH